MTSSNEHPNQHYFDQLISIYSHLDRTNTVGMAATADAPPGFANADMHAQENWGKQVRAAADGHSALFERDFGNGYKIFIFVFWAE